MRDSQQKIKNNFHQLCQQWDQEIVPVLEKYIAIPNKSPHFDAKWETNGYMDQAMALIQAWCEKQPICGKKIQLLQVKGRTPLLLIEIPGDAEQTILLYGHMDKQPEMTGWRDDLGPWKPVLQDGKLYGRGSADDGYAVFCALSSIAYLQSLNIPHARCVILIEACEESGSYDLPFYLKTVKDQIGEPDLIVCLDSECGNYEQLWATTSLRGLIGGTLTIDTIHNGIHSGFGSGVAPSVFHVLRQLLDRIEDPNNGNIHVDALHVDIPADRLTQTQQAAHVLGDQLINNVPFLNGVKPLVNDPVELLLNRTWRPALSITGMDGVPHIASAGNVTLPSLSVKLSMRVPPIGDLEKSAQQLKKILEKDPPFNAKVTFETEDGGAGWNAPHLAAWLEQATEQASCAFYGKSAIYIGMGGSIPLMHMLSELFPKAQFLITGVLGPQANAHGPNEFLHIDYVKKLTGCIASIIAAHCEK